MAQIDSLEIQITANAQKAVTSLKNLSNSLQNISMALARVNASGFSGLTNGINSLTNAMERYKSSAVKTSDFTRLATQLDRIANVNSVGINNMSGAISQLAGSTTQLASLSAKTSNITEFAKTLSKLGGVNIERATTNIPKLSQAMKELLTTLSQSPNISKNIVKLTRNLADLTKNVSGVKTASVGSAKGLNTFSNTAKKTTSASKGLASAIGKVYATYWLLFRAFSVFGKAINYSSDLTEVQNVVEQTFGQSTKVINEYAKASKETLGMSELTYKEIASRYQAMGVAMNISNNALKNTNEYLSKVTDGYNDASLGASGMSTTLTKLAGDMASFYNKDQKEVAEDLEAIYTGMTRPLRKYGLDLTQTTLQEYANARGIQTKVSAMTQAEKTMLRYQYVLENTTTSQGDFLRTANTWANQVKIMKQNFISLGTTVGQVFINAFKPFVQTLNKILVAVNNFAIKVANALGNIFGWTYEGNDVGILQDVDDSVGSLEDSLGGANKEAKKLKATIMGYDELNVMQDNSDNNGGGSGLSDALGGGLSDKNASQMGHWVKKYESEIDNLFDLGRKIADTLQDMMEGIDWDSIYEKARGFGKGLADFLNGLFKPEMFYQVGRTIAGALNTALNFAFGLGDNFDFEQLGLAIAEGINGFFETFDFELLAKTLNTWTQGIFTTIKTAIENIEWKEVWNGIENFVSELDTETIALIVGAWLTKKVLKSFASEIISKIKTGLGGTSILNGAGIVLFAIEVVLVTKKLSEDIEAYKKALNKENENIIDVLFDRSGETNQKKQEYAKQKSSNPYEKDSEYNRKFEERFGFITDWQEANQKAREQEKQGFYAWYDEIAAKFKAKFDEMGTDISNWYTNDVQPWFTKEKWETLWSNIKSAFKTKWDEISEWWKTSGVYKWYTEDVKPWFTVEKWQSLWEDVKSAFKTKWDEIVEWWKTSGVYKWYEEHVKPYFSEENWTFDGIKDGLEQAFNNAIDGIKSIWNKFATWINEKLNFSWDSVTIMGKQIISGGSINLGKIPTFATGGFPEDGLFMANHSELVGKFSNGRTAVANNQQITEGIKQAVVEGMMNVVMATSDNNRESGNINLYLDGKVIAQTTYNNLKAMGRQGVIPRFI